MNANDTVKFKNPINAEEAKHTMKVLENRGERVLVEDLIGWEINPTRNINKSELVTAYNSLGW